MGTSVTPTTGKIRTRDVSLAAAEVRQAWLRLDLYHLKMGKETHIVRESSKHKESKGQRQCLRQ